MSPEIEKKKSKIPQNFEIRDGKIVMNGVVIEPRPGIKPVPKTPQKP